MNLPRPIGQDALGFMAVAGDPQRGLFGGYLILGPSGRPLEFHCTAAVQASRAQEILFGPTLHDYLYGELIGQTLYQKASIEPLVVCTNHPAVLTLREFIPVPVVLVDDVDALAADDDATNSAPRSMPWRIDAAHDGNADNAPFRCGRNRLAVAEGYQQDRSTVHDRLASMAGTLDFAEPFARIQAAIDEAQRGGP